LESRFVAGAGQPGRLEKVGEIRLEMGVGIDELAPVIGALRASHPYEEPAFDLNILAALPGKPRQGKIGVMPSTLAENCFSRIKRSWGRSFADRRAGGRDESRGRGVRGSCGNLLGDAIDGKAELY